MKFEVIGQYVVNICVVVDAETAEEAKQIARRETQHTIDFAGEEVHESSFGFMIETVTEARS